MKIWRVGMKAICIVPSPEKMAVLKLVKQIGHAVPECGTVYTVLALHSSDEHDVEDFIEIEVPSPNFMDTIGWPSDLFRPVHDQTATVEAIKRKAIDAAANAPADAVSEGVE